MQDNVINDHKRHFTTSYYSYSDGVFFDEKNKRFVDMKFMDPITKLNYSGMFKNVIFFVIFFSIVLIFMEIEPKLLIAKISHKDLIC